MNFATTSTVFSFSDLQLPEFSEVVIRYKCPYCGTLHETKLGTCDRCGGSMAEAKEVME